MIKKWWTIDYEEYYNRKLAWTWTSSWHYTNPTWFWNFSWTLISWEKYWYFWNYANQFVTWSQASWDLEYTWIWPDVFTSWTDVKEIYLLSWNRKVRTFFRWNVKTDPDAPIWSTCDYITFTWTWCLWTIEFLKLDWKDYWNDHSLTTIDNNQNDWIIDTWLINKDFDWVWNISWSWTMWVISNDDLWQPIFPNTMNIVNFKVYPYPNSDIKLAWKDLRTEINIAPYLRISFEILPSWKNRKKIKWLLRPIVFSTTISLTDFFSK